MKHKKIQPDLILVFVIKYYQKSIMTFRKIYNINLNINERKLVNFMQYYLPILIVY